MNYKVISGIAGTGIGAGVGLISQREYEEKLRLANPQLSEDEIKKLVKKRKIKASVIGGIGGGLAGTAVGHYYDKSKPVVNLLSPKSKNSSNNPSRTSTSTQTTVNTSEPKITGGNRSETTRGDRSKDHVRSGKGKSKEYQALAEASAEAFRRKKELKESGKYRKGSKVIRDAEREHRLAFLRMKNHPEYTGNNKADNTINPNYRELRPRIPIRKAELVKIPYKSPKVTPESEPVIVDKPYRRTKVDDNLIEAIFGKGSLRSSDKVGFGAKVRAKYKAKRSPRHKSNTIHGIDPSQLFGGNVNIKMSDVVAYTIWFSRSF